MLHSALILVVMRSLQYELALVKVVHLHGLVRPAVQLMAMR